MILDDERSLEEGIEQIKAHLEKESLYEIDMECPVVVIPYLLNGEKETLLSLDIREISGLRISESGKNIYVSHLGNSVTVARIENPWFATDVDEITPNFEKLIRLHKHWAIKRREELAG